MKKLKKKRVLLSLVFALIIGFGSLFVSQAVSAASPAIASPVKSTTVQKALMSQTAALLQAQAQSQAQALAQSTVTNNSQVSPTAPITKTVDPTVSASATVVNQPVTGADIASASAGQDPEITNIKVTGAVDNNATGAPVFDGVDITLQANNLTPDNFLTPDGLHWSDKTELVPITGTAVGQLDVGNFGDNGPIKPATIYSMNDNDSGRLTYVGQTLSGIDLDMIYTVITSDKDYWAANSGGASLPVGVAFTGEQNTLNSTGDSIAAYYYGANSLSMAYQIVAHGTDVEMPVVASFITTDIDVAQGVDTNLANLMTIIPNTTNLKQDGNIIYDASPDYGQLYGASSLPYGGYLGVGFQSEFYYNYYAPAPARAEDSYFFSQGVRYDLFGSALQAHLTTQVRQQVTVNYYDLSGHQIASTDHYQWFTNQDYKVPTPTIAGYGFVNFTQDSSIANHPVINVYYDKQNVQDYRQGYINNAVYNDGTFYTPSVNVNFSNYGDTSYQVSYDNYDHTKNLATFNLLASNQKPVPSSGSVSGTGLTEQELQNYMANNGISRKDAISLLQYMDEVAKNNKGNKNHAVDNSLAYPSYYNDPLQPKYNDFSIGKYDRNNDDKINRMLQRMHRGSTLDLPHLATTLASIEKSGGKWDTTKGWASFPFSLRIGFSKPDRLRHGTTTFSLDFDKETILQQNGLVGDLLTNYDKPEIAADLDALIMANDPKWSKYPMNERLKRYYSQSPEEIDKLRRNEAKKFKKSSDVYRVIFSPGGVGLAGMGLIKAIKGGDVNNVFTHAIKSIKTAFNNLKNNAKNGFNIAIRTGQNVFNSFAEQVKASGEDIGQFVGGTVRGAQSALNARVIARQLAEAARNAMNYATNVVSTVWNGVTSVYNNYVAPVVNAVSTVVSQVVQAAGNVIHQVAQAVSHAVNNVVHAIGNAVNGVVNWVKNLW
ncbi:MAG: hypothetical protein LBI13_03480 [Streptococcaceae bacterium]|jgi:hypothetical protein|nr:hypothetical protein [Streptococcaceae bacterium]